MLGYSEDEPWQERSSTKQDAFGKQANQRAVEFLAQHFAPILGRDLTGRVHAGIEVIVQGQDVLIQYPRAFALEAINPQIRLEIGPLSAWVPNEEKAIRPYASERFPKVFANPSTTVRTIAVERTFWEKATILHQEAHRGPDKSLPPRYSRHYYDLYRLSLLPMRNDALANIGLLQEVVRFKMRFYRSPWAKYEEAKPGSFRLLHPPHNLPELSRDYTAMQAMLFGTVMAVSAF